MLYPLTFHPLLKERVWGGRKLEELYGKPLPGAGPVGESWEISDRPGDVSIISNGPMAGRDLRWLIEQHPAALLGTAKPQAGRFPLLVKILDARDKLSLQVHPPARIAAESGGEPKTEMWYVAHAEPGAELYVGLRKGVTRLEFEAQLRAGRVESCFHRVPVQAGDAMFLPSGRVHALGAGLVIFEIQQNSDTTYRVFDWNRLGLDGKPRQLHVPESLASIDFSDFEPDLASRAHPGRSEPQRRLVTDPLFTVDLFEPAEATGFRLQSRQPQIIGVINGTLKIDSGAEPLALSAGQFALIPAVLETVLVRAAVGARFLRAEVGRG